MIRKCFTINQNRTLEEIKSYEDHLVKTGIFQGCEIFYPYDTSKEQYENYVKEIKDLMKYDNFEIVCHLPHGIQNNIASYTNLEEIMNRYYKAIDFSAMFNIKKLTLHPGDCDGTLTKEEATKLSISNVMKMKDYAKKYGMTIMIENLVGSNQLCLTKEEMLSYLSHFNNEVKLTFDCGHCNASQTPSKSEVNDFVKLLKDYLWHVHISDNNGTTDQHGPIGSGYIDFVSFFQTLKNIGYQGLYSSEVLFKTYEDLMSTANKVMEIEKELE